MEIHIQRNTARYNKELINLVLMLLLYYYAVLFNIIKLKSLLYKIKHICFLYTWSKMLSSSLDGLLKLSKTTSPDTVQMVLNFFGTAFNISLQCIIPRLFKDSTTISLHNAQFLLNFDVFTNQFVAVKDIIFYIRL